MKNLKIITESGNTFNPALIPKDLASMPLRVEKKDEPNWTFCGYNKSQFSQLNSFAVKAIYSVITGAGDVAVIKNSDRMYTAETTMPGGTSVLINVTGSGQVKGAMVSPKKAVTGIPALPDTSGIPVDLSPLYACILMLACYSDYTGDPAVEEEARKMLEACKDKNPEDCDMEIHYLSDLLNYGLMYIFELNISGGNISLITMQTITAGSLNGETVCGTPKVLNSNRAAQKNRFYSIKEAKAMFADFAAKHNWTLQEEQFICKFPDSSQVSAEAVQIMNLYVKSRNFQRPMNNFLWRGTTAYGKSTAVEQISCVLNIPLLRMTCCSTMETNDFLTMFIPDNSAASLANSRLPSFNEIMSSPENAYYMMTGQNRIGTTPQECLQVYGRICAAREKTGVKFKMVESNFVRALRRGYLCEIQEMSRIKDPGALVALNEYDRAGALIPQPSGEFVRRHPDAMVIFTDNVGYVSCRPVDPSVMRRMDYVIDSFALPDEQIISRVTANTGFKDRNMLRHLMKVWKRVIEFCREQEINSGEISVYELERWVMVLMIEGYGSLKTACRDCVVAKATPDRNDQELIFQSILPLLEENI